MRACGTVHVTSACAVTHCSCMLSQDLRDMYAHSTCIYSCSCCWPCVCQFSFFFISIFNLFLFLPSPRTLCLSILLLCRLYYHLITFLFISLNLTLSVSLSLSLSRCLSISVCLNLNLLLPPSFLSTFSYRLPPNSLLSPPPPFPVPSSCPYCPPLPLLPFSLLSSPSYTPLALQRISSSSTSAGNINPTSCYTNTHTADPVPPTPGLGPIRYYPVQERYLPLYCLQSGCYFTREDIVFAVKMRSEGRELDCC
jgi:hypothetical protein